MKRGEYNEGYTHEALHAAHMCASMWDDFVVQTRCADEFGDVREAAEKAADALYNVYQLIGRKFPEPDETK